MNAHRPVVDYFAGLPKPEIIPHFPGTAFLPTEKFCLLVMPKKFLRAVNVDT